MTQTTRTAHDAHPSHGAPIKQDAASDRAHAWLAPADSERMRSYAVADDDIDLGTLLCAFTDGQIDRIPTCSYPGRATVEFLERHGRGRFVEIGAGNGTFARVLTGAGLDVVPTDAFAAARDAKEYRDLFVKETAIPVITMDGMVAARRYADRDVLLVMPHPAYDWYISVLNALAPGRRVFVQPDYECSSFVEKELRIPGRSRESRGLIAMHALLLDASRWKLLGTSAGRVKTYAFERL